MKRYDKIIYDAELASSTEPHSTRQAALIGWIKTEIKYLCKEIEALEEKCEKNDGAITGN